MTLRGWRGPTELNWYPELLLVEGSLVVGWQWRMTEGCGPHLEEILEAQEGVSPRVRRREESWRQVALIP